MSGRNAKLKRKLKKIDAEQRKLNLLLTMMIFKDDELFADLSDLQRKKKEGVIDDEYVLQETQRIAEKIMKKLDNKLPEVKEGIQSN